MSRDSRTWNLLEILLGLLVHLTQCSPKLGTCTTTLFYLSFLVSLWPRWQEWSYLGWGQRNRYNRHVDWEMSSECWIEILCSNLALLPTTLMGKFLPVVRNAIDNGLLFALATQNSGSFWHGLIKPQTRLTLVYSVACWPIRIAVGDFRFVTFTWDS